LSKSRVERARRSEAGDDQHIAGFEPANDLRQLRAVAAGASRCPRSSPSRCVHL
jgi:hypothetical protein